MHHSLVGEMMLPVIDSACYLEVLFKAGLALYIGEYLFQNKRLHT
jgi:hypothetical protein